MSKKLSVTVDDELHKKLEKRVQELDISKSAFVSFATSFLLHQLDKTEAQTEQYSLSAYQLLKHNLQQQQQHMEEESLVESSVKKKKKRKK